MNATLFWSLAGVAVIIIAGLSTHALTLWKEVRRREAFRRDEVRRANEQCLTSLDAIAQAMLTDQVDLTEGSLRCKVLLEIIDPRLMEREVFRPFGELHARTAHLHTHSARRELSPKQRFAEDRQRLAVESELETALRESARGVLEFKARWPASLH